MRNLGSGRLSSLPRSHGYTWQYWDYNQNLTQSAGPGPLCYPGSPAPLLLAVEQGYGEGGGWKEAGPGTPHLSAMLPPRVSQGYLLDLLGSGSLKCPQRSLGVSQIPLQQSPPHAHSWNGELTPHHDDPAGNGGPMSPNPDSQKPVFTWCLSHYPALCLSFPICKTRGNA